MRKYRASAASPIRVDYGVELIAGLLLFTETSGYAPSFESLNEELDASYTSRQAKRKPLVKARVALRFANYEVDQLIRSAARAAEIADGGRRGPIFQATFPEGVGPVVAPDGARQIPPTAALVDRITRSRVASIDPYRAEWLPKLQAGLAKLQAAAAAYDAARKDYLAAFADELALRQDHLLAVDRLIGLVRAAFPHDRARQDLVFPAVEEGDDVASAEGDGPAPSPDPAAPKPA